MKQRQKQKGTWRKSLGALGIVFGDIGTSPLYALPAAFALGHFAATKDNVVGVVSMILWAITIIVAVKYVSLIMRADNEGEGGIMALVALLRRSQKPGHHVLTWSFIGLVGVALFYGDSIITPAISVLSAVEGLRIAVPALSEWVIPISVVVLLGLFFIQSRGTAKLGGLFGPVMVVWFVVSGAFGAYLVMQNPAILIALSPLTALQFALEQPGSAFVALGAVILAITGAEALYADMGHFGRSAVQKSWFVFVYPALILTYLGQGSVLLANPAATSATYFYLFPGWLQFSIVLLATAATLIASQSVISGAFSLTRQAMQLGYVPPLRIKHTSKEAGQIYISGLNWLMCIAVLMLVFAFGSSEKLAGAYGMAESGTLFASTILLAVTARFLWRRSLPLIYLLCVIFGVLELLFVTSSLSKLWHGAWIPLVIAAGVLVIFTTWSKGSHILVAAKRKRGGSLDVFVASLKQKPGLVRVPGVAVYLANNLDVTPTALRTTVERLHELSKTVILVTVQSVTMPRVASEERAEVNELGDGRDGIVQVILLYGYNETPHVPEALEAVQKLSFELAVDVRDATYFISETDISLATRHPKMNYLRSLLFQGLHRISAPSPAQFHLPPERTIDMESYVEL